MSLYAQVGRVGSQDFEITQNGQRVLRVYSPLVWNPEAGRNEADQEAGMRLAYVLARFLNKREPVASSADAEMRDHLAGGGG